MLLLRTAAVWMLGVSLLHHVSVSSTVARAGRGKFTVNSMRCTWGSRDARNQVRLSVRCEDPEARAKGGVTELRCEYAGKPERCPGYQSDRAGFWKQVARAFKRLQGKVCSDERALVKAGMCKRAPRDAHFKLDVRSSVASGQSGDTETPPKSTRAPRSTSTPTTASDGTIASAGATACAGRADHRAKAEEYCNSAWASICSFLFSVLQSDC